MPTGSKYARWSSGKANGCHDLLDGISMIGRPRSSIVSSKLQPILTPRSVAVIGAGRDPTSISGRLYRNLRDRFRGPVYPINPRATTIDSARAFATVLAVPEPVDLAFVIVPAAQVLEVVRQCVRKHVRGLVVISAGYSETGPCGRDRQGRLRGLVCWRGMAMGGS